MANLLTLKENAVLHRCHQLELQQHSLRPCNLSIHTGSNDTCTQNVSSLLGNGTHEDAYLSALCKRLSGQAENTNIFLSRSISLQSLCPTHLRESLRGKEACLLNKTSFTTWVYAEVYFATRYATPTKLEIGEFMQTFQSLIQSARKLYVDDDIRIELDNTVNALDATTIDLCLSVFPWAHFPTTKAVVKFHTLLALRGSIPTCIHILDGKMHDVNVLDMFQPQAGAFSVMHRGYVDFWLPTQSASRFGILRNQSKIQSSIPEVILSSCGQRAWPKIRSNSPSYRLLLSQGPPRESTANQVLRCGN